MILFIIPSFFIALFLCVRIATSFEFRQFVGINKKRFTVWLILPGLVFLGMYYSLAFRMFRELGGWPERIGNSGFSESLILHSDVASGCFFGLILFLMFLWPSLILGFKFIPRLRTIESPVIALGISLWIAFAGIFLAPSDYLNWWFD